MILVGFAGVNRNYITITLKMNNNLSTKINKQKRTIHPHHPTQHWLQTAFRPSDQLLASLIKTINGPAVHQVLLLD